MWEPFRRPKEGMEPIKHTQPHAQAFAGQYRILLHKMLVCSLQPSTLLPASTAVVRLQQLQPQDSLACSVMRALLGRRSPTGATLTTMPPG